MNGFGLTQIERGRPREAAQFFAAAAKEKPDYGPALLNLATVAQQYLHDNALALQNYRAYLVLTPRPANWDAVNDIANSLEQPAAVAVANPLPAGGAAHAARATNAGGCPRQFKSAAREGHSGARRENSAGAGGGQNATDDSRRNRRPGRRAPCKVNPFNWFHSSAPEKTVKLK